MIIATIGNTKLKLESLTDAEALLGITSRATLVGSDYDVNYRDYQYVGEGEKRVTIEVTEGDKILAYDEHLELRAAHEEKKRKSAEVAKTGKSGGGLT